MSPWFVKLAEELWPRATWNDEIRRLWSDRFRNETRDVVEQAIRNVRCSKSSERVEIAWVIQELSTIKANLKKSVAKQEDAEDPDDRARREAEEVDAEIRQAEASLRLLTPEDLQSLTLELKRSLPGLRMHGEVSEWSRLAIGLAHALGMKRRLWWTPSPEPSPGLEPSCGTERSASTGQPKPSSSSLPAESPHGRRSDEGTPPSADPADCWFASL